MPFFGGIWLFWDDYLIDLDLLDCNEQLLTVAVKTDDRVNWIFSATYASPNVVYREALRSYIQQLSDYISVPLLMVGDFN